MEKFNIKRSYDEIMTNEKGGFSWKPEVSLDSLPKKRLHESAEGKFDKTQPVPLKDRTFLFVRTNIRPNLSSAFPLGFF